MVGFRERDSCDSETRSSLGLAAPGRTPFVDGGLPADKWVVPGLIFNRVFCYIIHTDEAIRSNTERQQPARRTPLLISLDNSSLRPS